ncbi:hypothetical protein L210DRAFT_983517 [Boletus edulis BED1]|uniref:Uncharacterized protein n=1 Tax=Boletus edulis BED1 TaxID=1328754 RepID=A0AAD4BHL3_BOLED|nr:hypothetical protein L210DRAFT_983517 [Boletus edulis BED1]
MPALTELNFILSAALSPFDLPLFFPSLHNLTLDSQLLKPISRLLSQIRLPVVRSFTAYIHDCPSRLQLSLFWASFRTASTGHTVERLKLTLPSYFSTNFTWSEAPLLGFEDLQPCLAFSNLRVMDINHGHAWKAFYKYGLGLEHGSWYRTKWTASASGVLSVAQTCRTCHRSTRLHRIPAIGGEHWVNATTPVLISVLDSIIEAESVPTMATFFASISSRTDFYLNVGAITGPNWEVYRTRWEDVQRRVRDIVDQHS